MTHFAAQLRVCKSELDLRLEMAGTDEERFAIAAMYGFELSVSVLFQARETQCNPEQFLASCGYITIASKFLRASKVKDSIWKNWPKRKAPLGQYHFSALVPTALGLAVQFTEGMYAEISLARLTAFPNQNVEVRELVELREWRETFWLQLKTNRPELADWPLWSLHQWRDEAVAQIRNEYEDFANVQAIDSAKKRSQSDDFITKKIDEIDSLSESELLQTASRKLMSFFHRWRRMPNDTERMEFNGTVGLSLALPQFEQEFQPLMRCLRLCQAVATKRNMECTSLDELVAMLRHYEVSGAGNRKFSAVADLDRIRHSLQQTKPADGAEAAQQSADEQPENYLNEDGRILLWDGQEYPLTRNMLGVVKVLFDAHVKGRPEVAVDMIRSRVDACGIDEGLSKVFQRKRRGKKYTDPVWGVIENVGPGVYRLRKIQK